MESLPKYLLMKILYNIPIQSMFKLKCINRYFRDLLSLEKIALNYKTITGKEFHWVLYILLKNHSQNLYFLHSHPTITWEDIVENPKIKWYYPIVSENPNIRWHHVARNPLLPWSFMELSTNPGIDIEEILQNPAQWIGTRFSSHPDVTWDHVLAYPHVPGGWNYGSLSKNKTVTLDIILGNRDLLPQEGYYGNTWDYRMLSRNPNITWDDVLAHPEIPWDYSLLSLNQNIKYEHVLSRPFAGWNYRTLSKNPNITFGYILETPERDWSAWSFSENVNLTWETVVNHPNSNWNWIEIIKRFPKEMAFELEKNKLVLLK